VEERVAPPAETCDDAERHATTPRDMRRRQEICDAERHATPKEMRRRLYCNADCSEIA
jgi:hypothetical protein